MAGKVKIITRRELPREPNHLAGRKTRRQLRPDVMEVWTKTMAYELGPGQSWLETPANWIVVDESGWNIHRLDKQHVKRIVLRGEGERDEAAN